LKLGVDQLKTVPSLKLCVTPVLIPGPTPYWIAISPSMGELIASLPSLSVTSVKLTPPDDVGKLFTVVSSACIFKLSESTSLLNLATVVKSESVRPLNAAILALNRA